MAINVDSLAERMGGVSHFTDMSFADRIAIVRSGQVLKYAKGTTIFSEGTNCAGLYVLLEGKVHLCKLDSQGHESIIAVITPVIMFNEVAVLDRLPNPVTAVAVSDCTAWQIGCTRFHALMKRYPQIGLGLLPILAARNRMILEEYENIAGKTVRARIAKTILQLSNHGQLPISRQEHPNYQLAAHAGTVPEQISRALKIFKQGNLINCTRTQINILQPDTLSTLAQA